MDKSYLNESLHKMADYLSTHGYEQPINLKTLSRPSGRDFKNIMGFLFRQIDNSYIVSVPDSQRMLQYNSMPRACAQQATVYRAVCIGVLLVFKEYQSHA